MSLRAGSKRWAWVPELRYGRFVVWRTVEEGPRVQGGPPFSKATRPVVKAWILPQKRDRPEPASKGDGPGGRAYNPPMFDTLQQLAATAFVQRFTLWLNHVLAGEDAATSRLRPHAGRTVRVHLTGWPTLLPTPPVLSFAVTRAGLLEWTGAEAAAPPDLTLSVDASNPALMMAQGLVGQRPAVDVSGDSALAGDVSWLMDNLRWDIEDDLARFIGQAPAHELSRIGRPVAAAMRGALSTIAGFATGRGARASAPQDPPAR